MKFYIDKNTVITYIGQNQYKVRNGSDGIEIIIDETGLDFIQAIDYIPTTLTEIMQRVIANYDNAVEEEVSKDLADFLDFMTKTGFIKKIDESLRKLQINLTERCNERCIHCYIPEEKRSRGGTLDYQLLESLIDDFCEMGGKELVLSGGEALLHPDLKQIVGYATSKGCSISILSNLSTLDERLIHILKKHHVEVQTSLYSTNEIIHDAITCRKGSCKKTKDAIKSLCHAGVPLTISCIVMRTNKDDFTSVLDFGESIGAIVQCNCGLNMDLDFNKKNISNRLTEEEVRDFYVALFNCQRKLGNKLFTLRTHDISSMTENLKWHLKQYPCLEIHSSCSVNGNGDVCPCGSFGLVIGNIKTRSLKEIWQEANLNNGIFKLLNEGMGICGSCKDYEFCYVCPSVKYNGGNGNFLKTDPYMCRVAQIASEVEKEFNHDNYRP
ncbi:MAG: radical SAM protein [Paramuribaculum sp.]|nr:radical SAM protein [Paramuribaculum sp.]